MKRAPRSLVAVLAALCGACAESPRSAERAVPRPDILLVTIDTLRADATGFSGNRRSATPAIDRLAARGQMFPRARAHSVVTLPSHASILTGLLPFEHGLRDNAGSLAPGVSTLATRLGDAGYATAAFVSAFPLDSRYGLDRGFATYDDRMPAGADATAFRLAERPGPETVSAALAWWEAARGRPRLLWVHLFEPHAPYSPVSPFAARFTDNPYLGEVAAADAALAPLLDAAGLSALVVLTSDHGESLGEHGEATHGLFAYEPTLRVPLVVAGPGIGPGRDERPAGHVDIVPTLLEAAGLPSRAPLSGRSLLGPAEAGRPHYFEALSASLNRGWAPLHGVIRQDRKLIDLPMRELYDLGADPGEKDNLAERRPDDVRDLARRIPAGSRGVMASSRPASEEAARLRSLGYLTAATPERRRPFGPEDDPKSLIGADRSLHLTIDLFQRGRTAEAVREAEGLVRAHPGLWLGVEQLAYLYQETGRLGDASRVLRDALRQEGAPEPLRVRLALVLAEAGRAGEALDVVTPLEGSLDPEAQRARGIVLAEVGRPDEARAAFLAALTAAPDDVETLADLGVLELRVGRRPEAVERFRAALARSPTHGRARAGLEEAGSPLARGGPR